MPTEPARDQQSGGQRDQECRHLTHQPITDGQAGEERGSLADRHVVADDADHEPAEDVDQRNDDTGDRVAAHEFARTIHGTVEIGLFGKLGATTLRFAIVDDTGVQIGIDRHLAAGQTIETRSVRRPR